jgi:hypothetical protein
MKKGIFYGPSSWKRPLLVMNLEPFDHKETASTNGGMRRDEFEGNAYSL